MTPRRLRAGSFRKERTIASNSKKTKRTRKERTKSRNKIGSLRIGPTAVKSVVANAEDSLVNAKAIGKLTTGRLMNANLRKIRSPDATIVKLLGATEAIAVSVVTVVVDTVTITSAVRSRTTI